MNVDLVKKGCKYAEGNVSKDGRVTLEGNRCREGDGALYIDIESLKIPHGIPGHSIR